MDVDIMQCGKNASIKKVVSINRCIRYLAVFSAYCQKIVLVEEHFQRKRPSLVPENLFTQHINYNVPYAPSFDEGRAYKTNGWNWHQNPVTGRFPVALAQQKTSPLLLLYFLVLLVLVQK